MKTILAPTDFSENADNAVNYAIAMAKKEKAKLMLLNVFNIPYPGSTFPVQFTEKEMQLEQHMVNKRLQLKCAAIRRTNKIKCEYLGVPGSATDMILKCIKQLKPGLVVMGTKGDRVIKGIFMGSTAAKVIEKAKCPVIAVPELFKYKDLKRIIYTTDFHASDIVSLKKLIEFARPFKAHINIIHIYDGEFSDLQRILLQKFQKKVEKAIKYKNMVFNLILVNNTGKELKRIAQSKSNDLLVMSTHHRYILDKLMNRSLTKKIATHANIPIIALHHREEPLVII